MKKLLLMLLGFAIPAQAGILDIVQYGVKGNPDRYVSVSLLAVVNHQSGLVQVPDLGVFGANQISQYNDRGMRGQVIIPLDPNSSFLIGGNWYTGDYAYDGTGVLLSQIGGVHGFGIEAGFKFYVHN